jgi:hypothetical protein
VRARDVRVAFKLFVLLQARNNTLKGCFFPFLFWDKR